MKDLTRIAQGAIDESAHHTVSFIAEFICALFHCFTFSKEAQCAEKRFFVMKEHQADQTGVEEGLVAGWFFHCDLE